MMTPEDIAITPRGTKVLYAGASKWKRAGMQMSRTPEVTSSILMKDKVLDFILLPPFFFCSFSIKQMTGCCYQRRVKPLLTIGEYMPCL